MRQRALGLFRQEKAEEKYTNSFHLQKIVLQAVGHRLRRNTLKKCLNSRFRLNNAGLKLQEKLRAVCLQGWPGCAEPALGKGVPNVALSITP